MEKTNILTKNQDKTLDIKKVENLENLMNKELQSKYLKPQSHDYIFGDCSYELRNGVYKVRDEPLFMFKKNSKFRQWAEKRLGDNNLENYTVVYKNSREWYDTILIVDKSKYSDFYISSA